MERTMAARTELRSPAPDIMDDYGRWINPFCNGMTYEQMVELEKYQDKVQKVLNKQYIETAQEALF